METKTSRLGEILFEEGLIQEHQLQQALDLQKTDSRKLGELLVSRGWIEEEKLSRVLARIYNLPFIHLPEFKIDENVLKLLPQEFLQAHKVLPLSIEGQTLNVATNDPLNVSALQEMQYKSGYVIAAHMASLRDIEEHLQRYADSFLTFDAMQAVVDNAEEPPIVQLVDSIIGRAIKEKASDIHFEPQEKRMRVRFRIDGVLYEKMPIPQELARKVTARIKVISGMDVAETRRPKDGRTTLNFGSGEYDIRISSLPDKLGENLVLRLLNKKFINRSFAELGMDSAEEALMQKLLARPYGLLLVTGPTGAGKTTTLYSVLNRLNQVSKNIITVEDPVEYEIKGITQTSVSSYTGYTFATAIRHILRHDPDVIMVGEIRDVETAEIAIRAALTGHLVLSTMHTNSAAGAITRLLEMDIEPFLISSAINGVIAQRLVRRLCPHCLKTYVPEREVLDNIHPRSLHLSALDGEAADEKTAARMDAGKFILMRDKLTFADCGGCPECLQTGYSGRVGLFEILNIDGDIRKRILKCENEEEIAEAARTKGMRTLRMAGMHKVVQKMTTLQEVMRTTFVD